MAISIHPEPGTIVICDFDGYKPPEMVKRRPAIVVSPRLRERGGLCTVVPLSTTDPRKVMPYHHRLAVAPPLPHPYSSPHHWVKADMMATVAFERLSLPCAGKDSSGKRVYDIRVIDEADLRQIRVCLLHGLGLSSLTAHL